MTDFDFLVIPEKVCSLDSVTYQYFNQLLNHRTIIFNDTVDESVIESVYLPLKDFEEDDSDEPITMILNSPGGSVSDGFFLANYLTHFKKKLNIIVTGCAASMAAVILAGGGKNLNVVRKAYPSSYCLVHDGYVTLAPQTESKSAQDFLEFNNTIDQKIKNFIIENTGMSEELYDSKTRKQWFILADEAKELNLIDEIIGVDC